MTNIDPQELVSRYVAVWNQPDAELRRRAIHDLWTEDGARILGPPQEIRKAATGLGFPSTTLEARGHDELEVRVTRAYEEFVAPGGFAFQLRDNAGRRPPGRRSARQTARAPPGAGRRRPGGSRPTRQPGGGQHATTSRPWR